MGKVRKRYNSVPLWLALFLMTAAALLLAALGTNITETTARNKANEIQNKYMTATFNKKLGGFSGGMKQRALLCQALLGDPEVVILDEPTAGLDPKERIRIRDFISSMSHNRIILLATHIVSDIESISNQIMMMKQGRLIGTGTPAELVESVADKVKELPCAPEDLEKVQARYKVGNVFQRRGETWVRVIGDDLPAEGRYVKDHLSLEDVYLYYLGE